MQGFYLRREIVYIGRRSTGLSFLLRFHLCCASLKNDPLNSICILFNPHASAIFPYIALPPSQKPDRANRPYFNRATSRNCRAVASRNVSTLAPAGISNPDFA